MAHADGGKSPESAGAYRTAGHADVEPQDADGRSAFSCAREAALVTAIAALEKKNQQLEDDLAAARREIAQLRAARATKAPK